MIRLIAIARPRPRRALTLIEVVISLLITGTMLAASLYAVGASRKTTARSTDAEVAAALADDLLAYIYRLPYQSPSGSILGIELGNLLADKTTLDDVDDFNGYEESPPTSAANTPLTGFTGWTRGVTVGWVSATDPSATSASETGVKRIVVIVTKNSAEIARRVALRTNVPATAD